MIFHKHRVVFLHVAKTAGTAIENYFMPQQRDPAVANRDILFGLDKELGIDLQHATLATVRQLTSREIFEGYYKFSIVRNPFQRLVSAYNYRIKSYLPRFGSFEAFIRHLPEGIGEARARRGDHITPQVRHTHEDGRQAVDLIGRFEQLDTAMIVLAKRLGLSEPISLAGKPPPNLHPQKASMDSYNDDLIAIIQNVYREDFDLLGYDDVPTG